MVIIVARHKIRASGVSMEVLAEEQMEKLKGRIRQYITNPARVVYLGSSARWIRESIAAIKEKGAAVVQDDPAFSIASEEFPPEKVRAATALIGAQMSDYDVIVVLPHGPATSVLPKHLALTYGIDTAGMPEGELSYGQGLVLNVEAKSWQRLL